MSKPKSKGLVPGSFRDPSGVLFFHDDTLLRQVNLSYKKHYDKLISSGLYERLVGRRLLVPHEEAEPELALTGEAYKVIKPERIKFISYPYEWCFSELKDAALTTLAIQKTALEFGMSLKDASAYNIQFRDGKPVLIDTLSFEIYREGEPWVAYRQFCQHFLAPLATMANRDVRLGRLLRVFLDGLPLDFASTLLPLRARLRPSLFLHIHLHSRSQKRFAAKSLRENRPGRRMPLRAMLGLVESLRGAVEKLQWKLSRSEWSDYYAATNYTSVSMEHKKEIVSRFLDEARPEIVWDLGANVGRFSRIAASKGAYTVAFDGDPVAVEINYCENVRKGESKILPLFVDLTNPSPGIGWHTKERMSLLERGPADAVFALALIHHLAISNNVPLRKLAEFFRDISKWLIIEFVPKDDSQVQRLLASREDIFVDYTQENFEAAFGEYFSIRKSEKVKESLRTLYLMANKTLS